jgi:hypothetical protein
MAGETDSKCGGSHHLGHFDQLVRRRKGGIVSLTIALCTSVGCTLIDQR